MSDPRARRPFMHSGQAVFEATTPMSEPIAHHAHSYVLKFAIDIFRAATHTPTFTVGPLVSEAMPGEGRNKQEIF